MFFFMLINLGLGSMIGTMTGITTPILDAFKIRREILCGESSFSFFQITFLVCDKIKLFLILNWFFLFFFSCPSVVCCVIAFLLGLLFVQRSGNYFVTMFDDYSAGLPLTVVVILENISVAWIYGTKRYSNLTEYVDWSHIWIWTMKFQSASTVSYYICKVWSVLKLARRSRLYVIQFSLIPNSKVTNNLNIYIVWFHFCRYMVQLMSIYWHNLSATADLWHLDLDGLWWDFYSYFLLPQVHAGPGGHAWFQAILFLLLHVEVCVASCLGCAHLCHRHRNGRQSCRIQRLGGVRGQCSACVFSPLVCHLFFPHLFSSFHIPLSFSPSSSPH